MHQLWVKMLFCGLVSFAWADEERSAWSFSSWKKKALNKAGGWVAGNFKQGGADRLFYFPIGISKTLPSDYGYNYEDVEILSRDGTKLHGWKIATTQKKAKGVMVFAHGNTGSINNHFGFCGWLLNQGYTILMFDYRGYGKSEGKPERKGMIEDVQASLRYAILQAEWRELPIVLFGHSLGAAKSIVALEQMPAKGRIKAAIFWAGFSSYVKIAKKLMGDKALQVVTDDWAPNKHIGKIEEIPILFVHGKKDGVIPYQHSEELNALAKTEKKILFSENGGHNDTLWKDQKKLQKQISGWLDEQL